MKIYIKYHNPNCLLEQHGNWIDLKSAEDVAIMSLKNHMISLGVSIKLPKYFQANIVPRSSTFNKYGIIQANHYGVVDGPNKTSNGYSGNDDIWYFNAVALRRTQIKEGDRIAQFEIRPTMNAPWWAKLKWLFSHKIEIRVVDDLGDENRGGFGSSDIEDDGSDLLLDDVNVVS